MAKTPIRTKIRIMKSLLDSRIVRMPSLAQGGWLNSAPLTKEQLRGQVTLVDFWDYTCVNCLRTLPYLKAWHERYADKGLTVIGIHAPEFKFGRDRQQIEAALAEWGLTYPVLLDNEYENWHRFANRAWPTKYLIDADGYIRYQQQGEGYYQETERAIQELLRQRDASVSLPAIMPLLRSEDQPGAVCYPTTPELHTGSTTGLFGGVLGNPKGYVLETPMMYQMPPRESWQTGSFYLDGFWQAHAEYISFAGQDNGCLELPYAAVGVNAVLSPTGDEVALRLGLLPAQERRVLVKQDRRWLHPGNVGRDVQIDEYGISYVNVTRPRLYELVQNADFGVHDLQLIFQATGLAVYAFTFTSCVKRG